MVSFSRMKNFLVAKGLQQVVPMLSDHSPDTLLKIIDTMRNYGTDRMRKNHRGTPEELGRRIEAATSFWDMAKRKFPVLSDETKRKLTYNIYMNAINIGDEKRDEYFKKHGEYPPFFLAISPSMACNLRCFGCYAWKYPKEKSLSLEKTSAIIQEAKDEMGIYFITLTGGEPTFWGQTQETYAGYNIIKLAEEHDDCFFQFYTHGMNINEDMAKKLGELGNLHPSISIEGNEELTDKRRGKGAYKNIMDSMDRLKKHGVLFGFSITHTRHNHDIVCSGEYMDHLIEKGCGYGWYFQYIPIGREPDFDLVPTAAQRAERRDAVLKMRREKPILTYDFWNDGDSCEGCIAWGRKYLHVTAQGLVEPCVFVHFAVDSVHDKSLGECVRSDCFREARARQPFTNDLRMPCPQIDQPHHLKQLVEKYGMKPTHDGAEKIIGEHHDLVCRIASEYANSLPDDSGAMKYEKPSTATAADLMEKIKQEKAGCGGGCSCGCSCDTEKA